MEKSVLTSTPQTTVDIEGDLSIKPITINITTAGTFGNVAIGNRSFVRIESTSAISISGFENGYNGKILMVYNNSGQNVTFKNLDASSNVANRINTLNGADITTTGSGIVTFIYNSAVNKWLVIAVRE